MKKTLFFAGILSFLIFNTVSAQLKIGYVDSDAIMQQIPDAQDAQRKIDALVLEWREELNRLEKDWQVRYNDYERRKLTMSEPKRVEVERELVQLEEGITKFRQEKFGPQGELFAKQDELMKPVQNMVFNAIQDVAEEEELDFVFDRSGDILFLYAKDDYDITNLVLEKLK